MLFDKPRPLARRLNGERVVEAVERAYDLEFTGVGFIDPEADDAPPADELLEIAVEDGVIDVHARDAALDYIAVA